MEVPAESAPVTTVRRPWLTWLIGAACLVIFAGLLSSGAGEKPSWELLARWGAPPAQMIWRGAYWGLVTSAFVHIQVWHIAFNLYWLWIFGRVLETAIGPLRWMAFFLGSATVSSAAQLAATGETGIGLSGVLYAAFGFLWVCGSQRPAFAAVVKKQTVNLFLGWLVFCMVATALGVLRIGNVAHVAGLAFGAGCAWAFVRAPRALLPKAAIAALFAGVFLVLSWCPWQFEWVATKAYDAHVRGDYKTAVEWYLRAERFDRHRIWALRNLALAYANLSDAPRYIETMERLHSLDPQAGPGTAEMDPPRPMRTPSD
jgi:rhomboid protease GluP